MRNKEDEKGYNYHNPVLRDLTIDLMITKVDGVYIDGTLGGGGHAAKILNKLISGGKLLAFDKDINAIEYCKNILSEEEDSGRLTIIRDCFSNAHRYSKQFGKIDGLLLDLGVSSNQLDSDSIGLSYRVNSALDMRFSGEGISAAEIVNSANEDELLRILRDYGEEPNARAIARRIIERRRGITLDTTFALRSIIEECVPEKFRTKALSRVFQAFRIAVNDELAILEKGIRNIIPYLNKSARIVVMSYHSLEDRITKNIFKELAMNDEKSVNIITKKPIVPDMAEMKKNPRARSVKIRVAEKT